MPSRRNQPASAAAGPGHGWEVTHCGEVTFDRGSYQRAGGSANWHVQPIPGFGLDIGPPLGQIRVVLEPPVANPYIVLLSAMRTPGCPLLCANHGDIDEDGFVARLFDPVNTRTLQNGGFTFAVLSSANGTGDDTR